MANIVVNPGFELNNGSVTSSGWAINGGGPCPVAGSPHSGSWCGAVDGVTSIYCETLTGGGSETEWEYAVATVTRCELWYKSPVACHVTLIFDNQTQQRNVVLGTAAGWKYVNLLSQVHAYVGHHLDAILFYNDGGSATLAYIDDVFVSNSSADALPAGGGGAGAGASMNVRAVMFFWLISGLGEVQNIPPQMLDQTLSRALERPPPKG